MFSLRIALMTLVLALAGCASGVKLDDVQVEDRTGTSNSNNSGAVAHSTPAASAASSPARPA